MTGFREYFFSAAIVSILATSSGAAQTKSPDSEHKKSLVFKGAEPEYEIVVPRYDRTAAQLWETFRTVQKANSGDPIAQHELGLRYLTGTGFQADTLKAALWIQKAASQNLVPAMYNYGILLNNGWGVPWNPFEAYKQFEFAASKEMKEAEYVLGLLMTDNLIVPRDYPEAYRWLLKAERDGYAPAAEVIAEFYHRGLIPDDSAAVDSSKKHHDSKSVQSPSEGARVDTLPDIDPSVLVRDVMQQSRTSPAAKERESQGFEKEDSLSLGSVRAAAESESPEALVLLGYWYENGRLGTADRMMASVCYLRALRLESPWAPILLEKLTTKDRYFDHLHTRVNAHDPMAEFIWAGLIMYNIDHQITQEQARQFLRDAASQKYAPALVMLGMCYYNGNWEEENRNEAERLLREAAREGSHEAELRLAMLSITETGTMQKESVVKSLQQAEAAGSVLAQAVLGYCYETGVGVQQNKSLAIWYYRKASSRGNRSAYHALKAMYDKIRPKDPDFRVVEDNG